MDAAIDQVQERGLLDTIRKKGAIFRAITADTKYDGGGLCIYFSYYHLACWQKRYRLEISDLSTLLV